MAWFLWAGAALILGIIEVLSVDLFFLMLGLSALGAAGAAALGFSFTVQVAVFSVSAVLLLFLVRPWAKNLLLRSTPDVQTNVHALVGKEAIVTETVTRTHGRVRLDGEIWSARCHGGEELLVNEHVQVVQIDGATALVAPLISR